MLTLDVRRCRLILRLKDEMKEKGKCRNMVSSRICFRFLEAAIFGSSKTRHGHMRNTRSFFSKFPQCPVFRLSQIDNDGLSKRGSYEVSPIVGSLLGVVVMRLTEEDLRQPKIASGQLGSHSFDDADIDGEGAG